MRRIVFLILLIFGVASAVVYDTTAVYTFSISIQQNGEIRHYNTIGGNIDNASRQLSIVFTQMQGEGIVSDSILVWFNVLEFITADGDIDTCYTILTDVDMMNPTYDTLSVDWFDNDTWHTVYDTAVPYYVPVE